MQLAETYVYAYEWEYPEGASYLGSKCRPPGRPHHGSLGFGRFFKLIKETNYE